MFKVAQRCREEGEKRRGLGEGSPSLEALLAAKGDGPALLAGGAGGSKRVADDRELARDVVGRAEEDEEVGIAGGQVGGELEVDGVGVGGVERDVELKSVVC